MEVNKLIPAALVGASAGAVLGLGWLGVLSMTLLNVGLQLARARKGAE